MRRRQLFLIVAMVMIVAGGLAGMLVQTNGGQVNVKEVTFAGPSGQTIEADLYVPSGATDESPSPGVVATHGYINSKETQSPFAIEFARRGMVVLAIDQTGHGYSDPPAFSAGFGGPPALSYMQTLSFVDNDNIALEGHSMGGWASVATAATYPDGYESVTLVGSSTASFPGVPDGTAEFPRNTAVVFSEYDEFSMLMWGIPHASDVERSEKLQTLFGTEEPVEEGRTYGSIDEGTARQLYTPTTTHPGDHLSTTAVGNAIEWQQRTLAGTDDQSPNNQIWFLKELATLLSLIGGVLFLFPFGATVLSDRRLGDVVRDLPAPAGATGVSRYLTIALAAIIPVVTYLPLNLFGQNAITPSWLFPQQITNGVMVWAIVNAAVIVGLFAVWHLVNNRGVSRDRYGFDVDGPTTILASVVASVAVVGTFYLLLAGVGYLFGTDFRFWVFAVKLPSALQLGIVLRYLLPLTLFFLAFELLLNGQLRTDGAGFRRAFATNWIAGVGGFVGFQAVQYGVLLSGRPLPFGEPLLTIVAFQFIAVLTIATAVSTYFFRQTGRVWTGAFVNALLVTTILVAGTATHAPL